jgi:hypothetical protein
MNPTFRELRNDLTKLLKLRPKSFCRKTQTLKLMSLDADKQKYCVPNNAMVEVKKSAQNERYMGAIQ